jgi:hypothetical protein
MFGVPIIEMQSAIDLFNKHLRKKKERFETILEPLQAVVQIALLAFYPIGTKITIKNNILLLQPPAYSQSLVRWYNNDAQEDLYYLFNVFTRFKKFYKHLKTSEKESIDYRIYSILNDLSIIGINNLIRTYNQTEKPHILKTLSMFKFILSEDQELNFNTKTLNEDYDTSNTVDDIFIQIVDVYTDEIKHIIFNVLQLIKNNECNYQHYAEGLNKMLEPTCIQIKKWIDEHIVY